MFIELITDKDEEFIVNINHIVYAGKSKKGSFIVLSDGLVYNLKCPYDEFRTFFRFISDTGVFPFGKP